MAGSGNLMIKFLPIACDHYGLGGGGGGGVAGVQELFAP